MSGTPNKERVRRVLELLAELGENETALATKAPEFEALGKELGLLHSRAAQLQGELKRSLEEMDVEAPGHAGWSGRMGWLLAEFRRQLLTGCAGADSGEGGS